MIIKVSVLDRNIFSRWHPKIKDYLIKNSNFKGYISLDYKFRVRTNVTGMIPLNINNKFIFKYQDTFQQNNLDLRNKIIKIIKNYLINVDEISCIGGESYIYMIINSIKGNYYCNQEKLKQEADFNLKTNQNFLIDYNKIIKLKLNNSLILNLSKLNINLLKIINHNQKVKLIIIINCHHQDFWKKIKHLSNFKLNKRIYLTDFNYFITVNIFYQKKIILNNKSLFYLLKMFLSTLLLSTVISQNLYNNEFQQFIKKYNKTYDTESEYWYRYGIFKKNYLLINNNFTLKMNYFGDFDSLEYTHVKGYYNLAEKNLTLKSLTHKMNYPLPDAIDWRAENLVTPIKNQGQCGSCWAFSTTGVIEGIHARQTGNLVSLSEQQLVDCSQGNYGCGGGWPSLALENIIKRGGIDTEKSYPYQGDDESCSYNKSNIGASIKSIVNITKYNMTQLVNAIGTIGPISVAIDASDPAFQFYSGGIYTSKVCSPDNLDHAVLAIGYGITSNKSKYFIIKNSWGMDWGEEGFMYFNRYIDNMCGIVMDAVYAQ